jgi:hypothetical protein
MGSGANTPDRAGRPIEHPGRNLQPSPGCLTREAATENLSASLLNHLMNMDQASGPGMPRIKKLVLRDPVGVPSSCCITRLARTFRSTRTRRSREQYMPLVAFCLRHFSADFIICTCEFEFRQAHPTPINIWRRIWRDLLCRTSYRSPDSDPGPHESG